MADNLEQYRELFFSEADELMARYTELLVEFEAHPESTTRLQELFRLAHTLKGMAATMGFTVLGQFMHECESLLDGLRKNQFNVTADIISALLAGADAWAGGLSRVKAREDLPADTFGPAIARLQQAKANPSPTAPSLPTPPPAAVPASSSSAAPASTTLRVDVRVLDELLNLVGELVIVKTRLEQQAGSLRHDELERTVHQAHRLVSKLQDKVLDSRVVPLREILNRFPRLVRDLALAQHKEADLTVEGGEIGLDRAIVDGLAEPLTHIINNAVTHGLETPDARQAVGKPARGRVTIRARREPGFVLVEVTDDGQGMDPARLKQKAVQLGLVTPDDARRLSDHEALMLVTLPGLSTADAVTTAAGRGVGMDVVREKIHKLQGSLSIESAPGRGSTIRLRLPLTLTIMRAFLVRVNGQTFALPALSVKELVATPPARERESLPLGSTTLSVRSLARTLGLAASPADASPLVILEAGNRQVAWEVTQLLQQQEVVVKPLPHPLRALSPYAGATILGDGTVALILDLDLLFALPQPEALPRAA